MAWTIVMTALVAAPAIAVGSGRAAIWAAFTPPTVRAAAAVAGAVLRAFVVVSALVFLVALAVSFGDAATMTSRLHPSPVEAALYAVVNAAFVPNASLFTGVVAARPRLRGGRRHPRLAGGCGPRPAARLPAARGAPGRRHPARLGRRPDGAAAAAGGRRRLPCAARPRSPWDQLALAGCGGGLVAGFGFALLAALSGGAAGPGRMRFIGPFVPDVLVHAVTAFGLGGLLGAVGVVLINRRANKVWGVPSGAEQDASEPAGD